MTMTRTATLRARLLWWLERYGFDRWESLSQDERERLLRMNRHHRRKTYVQTRS